jgi:hypothetical protein
MHRDDARWHIITVAWLGRTAVDGNDRNRCGRTCFLKGLRFEQPLLFGFIGKQNAHAVAFS